MYWHLSASGNAWNCTQFRILRIRILTIIISGWAHVGNHSAHYESIQRARYHKNDRVPKR
jgi:hypothetical protein